MIGSGESFGILPPVSDSEEPKQLSVQPESAPQQSSVYEWINKSIEEFLVRNDNFPKSTKANAFIKQVESCLHVRRQDVGLSELLLSIYLKYKDPQISYDLASLLTGRVMQNCNPKISVDVTLHHLKYLDKVRTSPNWFHSFWIRANGENHVSTESVNQLYLLMLSKGNSGEWTIHDPDGRFWYKNVSELHAFSTIWYHACIRKFPHSKSPVINHGLYSGRSRACYASGQQHWTMDTKIAKNVYWKLLQDKIEDSD
jgi:hypothetical protein